MNYCVLDDIKSLKDVSANARTEAEHYLKQLYTEKTEAAADAAVNTAITRASEMIDEKCGTQVAEGGTIPANLKDVCIRLALMFIRSPIIPVHPGDDETVGEWFASHVRTVRVGVI